MARKYRWSPSGMPSVRHELVALAEHWGTEMVEALRRGAELDTEGQRLWHNMKAMQRQHSNASLYWVTSDMASLALDASHDVPDLDMDEAPDRSGIIGLEKPMPPLPVLDEPGAPLLAPSVVSWWRSPGVWHVSPFALASGLRPEDRAAHGVLPGQRWLPLVEASIDTDRRGPLRFAESALPAAHAALVAWVSATWRLMVVPTLVERRSLDARTGERRDPDTHVDRPELLVTTLGLRPLRQVDTGTEADPETGRTYTHRWMVRGHWRQQAYGPGRSQRRTQYVEPYIKGPAGAPLLARDKVWVWRR